MTEQVDVTSAALGPMDVRGVLAALPHRYPMLLIDRVVSLVKGKSIHA
ncbi:MAG: 3-hydroxyacyl-[acyl-carrier-protein] dehydratase FabZ, partial [bacterium]|nr:3-hydroxyacyl-[acyl-carrier-protein] dehydratase FabZ [bacterium]